MSCQKEVQARRVSKRNRMLKLILVFILIFGIILALSFVQLRDKKNHEKSSNLKAERWRPILSSEDDEVLSRLDSLGYLSGYNPAPLITGVTVYDQELAFDGVNLYTSGHSSEAFLMDMEGNVLHKWQYDVESLWPKLKGKTNSGFFRRVYLLSGGDLLAIIEGYGLIKLDKSSNLVWAHQGWEHHDLDVAPSGDIYVLTRKSKRVPTFPIVAKRMH